MRRIVLAALGTVSSLVLIFAYPTSHNASVTTGAQSTPAQDATDADSDSDSDSADAADSDDTADSDDSNTADTADTAGTGGSATTYTGDAVDTEWGVVQVRITVEDGKVTASEAIQHPSGNGHNDRINAYAVPILNAEVVSAQSADIDSVSGATVTSDGYVASLQSALDAAHL